jgi:uncharacterized protein GlcG (DUF336 family)
MPAEAGIHGSRWIPAFAGMTGKAGESLEGNMMDFEKAMKFLETAKSIGRAKGVEVSVAILDAAGHPVLVARGKPDSWHLIEIIPGGVTLNPGGVPIYENGECIGAIGVGGSSPQGDHEVARKTVEALGAHKPGTGKDKEAAE